ncbi:TetR/AcrR family transcriptional regulator [Leucobacter albus]|uniref:TetR/AcrR family transcriptional regulator n=1 Tax=Leucobacter albus TaxID=272210 RepID=A0ABW3TS96_9MICO
MAYRSTERTEQHRLARSEALVAAGHEIVAEQGFGAATIARVADRAGVSAGTVYTYFPDKTALSAAIFDRAAGIELDTVRAAVGYGTEARLATPAQQRLDALVRVFGARALRGRTLASALLFEAADVGVERERLVFRRGYTETVAEILSDGVREGSLVADRLDLLAPAIVGALGEAFIRPLMPGPASEPEAVLDTLAAACQRLAGFATFEPPGAGMNLG